MIHISVGASPLQPCSVERRRDSRIVVGVGIDLCPETSNVPMRAKTTDLSLGGCYVEMPFPLDVGTILNITMWIGESKLTTKGKVVTRHPQFGNGIEFLDMAPEGKRCLQALLNSAEQTTSLGAPNAR